MPSSKRLLGALGAFMVAAAVLPAALPAAAATSAVAPGQPDQGGTERYLVSFSPGADVANEAQGLRSQGVAVGKTFSAAVRGAVITATKGQAAALARSPRIAAIEVDAPVSLDETQQSPPWGLDRIDQQSLPLSGTFTPPSSGAGVNAYVIDTGVLAAHTDFSGRVAAGWTAVADGLGSGDCNGHGTHVAGTIAGRTFGVAKAATIVPVRVLDCEGSGYDSDVVAGLDWIAAHHAAGTPAVANLSLGSGANSVVDAAVRGVISDGVTTVVAAGNTGVDACTRSPARVPEALTVAASDSSDRQAWFSNHGSCVDLYAPGVGILSAGHTSTTATATLNGTSMAAPHVAGAAAVVLSQNPGHAPAGVSAELTSAAVPGVITGASPGTPNRLLNTGREAWLPAPVAAARDFTGDGLPDLLARDTNGTLWTYPGTGNGLFGWRIKVGDGWNVMTAISAAGDLTGDGKPDLTARDTNGTLWTYPGTGNGLFGWRIKVGDGWNVMTAISAAGDLTGDGKPDLTARDTNGTLWTYPGTGNGLFGWRIKVGDGWNVMTAISAAGDLTGDGKPDLTARDTNGTLWTYPGTGNGLFGWRINVGDGWNVMTAISAAGDLTGDGKPDLTARDTNGTLWTYPGTGNGLFGWRINVGDGWNVMTAIS
ncbi:S8 family serine peptidase [Pseudarthrobacter sp. L1SW]|uniref:S8 family serine peptidase n=1 Tax=Pseudarthrobacter sp. L1SW TaxID=2851598 RepID=UPI001E4A4A38|nr:S8 family serine peptidase [Pseudarthrobacter sp. L1SW]UEL29504.1 S8 family serine peptidase [Pseudarthrobacter sp. L1SW]